jgi:hypothetical protein
VICLIKQQGAEIVAWFMGPTIESVALQSGDDALTKELMTGLPHYSIFGNYRLQEGRYTLLVGSGDARERALQAG